MAFLRRGRRVSKTGAACFGVGFETSRTPYEQHRPGHGQVDFGAVQVQFCGSFQNVIGTSWKSLSISTHIGDYFFCLTAGVGGRARIE